MSGGRMNYLCYSIENEISNIPDIEIKELAQDFAKLMHDLEWYLSCDYGEGSWTKSLEEFREKWLRNDGTDRIKEYVKKEMKQTEENVLQLLGMAMYCKDCENFTCGSGDYGDCKERKERYLFHQYDAKCDKFTPRPITQKIKWGYW